MNFKHFGTASVFGLAAALASAPATAAASEQVYRFQIPSQGLGDALRTYGLVAHQQMMFSEDTVAGRRSAPLAGEFAPDRALRIMLSGTGLKTQRTSNGMIFIAQAPRAEKKRILYAAAATTTAQQPAVASDAQVAEAAPEPTEGLTEIIVTAQRRSENLQRAAIAVTAVDADTLVRAGVTDTARLTNVAPALQIGTVFGPINTFFIRGVGNFAVNTLSDPAVSFNVDGVNFARPSSASGVFYDLERVEVLKGPQGTLYGRNATGGAINVITTKPKLNDLNGYVRGEYGNFDALKLTAAINAPIGENSALRVAGQLSQHDGYYSDGTGDERQRNIRATFYSELGDNVRVTVGADYSHQGGKGAGTSLIGLDKDKRIGLFDPRAQALYSSAYSVLGGSTLNPITNSLADVFQDNSFWGVYAQADIDTPLGTLTIIPSYRRGDVDYLNFSSSFGIREKMVNRQSSLEARLVSDSDQQLSYIFGLYYQRTKDTSTTDYDQHFSDFLVSFEPITKSYAAFGRLTFKVTDQFRLTGGARYTIDDKSADIYSINATTLCLPALPPGGIFGFCEGQVPTFQPTLTPRPILFAPNGSLIPFQPYGATPGLFLQATDQRLALKKTFRKLTYRVGAEYDLSPRSLLYATYETGFKSGGFFQSIDTATFEPETISAITLGSKNRFLDNRLQVNLELYRWMFKNQQFTHLKGNSVGSIENVTENIGRTRIQGIELEVAAKVTPLTTLNATIQYLDAVNKEFTYLAIAAAGPPATGCIVTPPVAGYFTVNCDGRRPQQSPKWALNFGAAQRIPLGETGELLFNLGGRYQSGAHQGPDLLPQDYQKGYFMADADLTFISSNDRFMLGAFVNNITDKNVIGFSSYHPQAHELFIASLRPPRTYGVRAGVKF